MARENAGQAIGPSHAKTKLAMPSPCSASATKLDRSRGAGSMRRLGSSAPATAMSIAARGLSCCRRRVSRSTAAGVARSVFEMISRSARMTCLRASAASSSDRLAVHRIDHREHDVDVKFAAERAIGGEGLQDRRRIGEPRCLDQDAGERRHRAALAVEHEPAQRDLQIGARDAAQAAVAEEHGCLGAVAHQRIVDADSAELVDDHRGALAFRRLEKPPDQRRLAGAEKAGDDRHRNPRAALALEPPPERARLARGEQIEQIRNPSRGCTARRHGGRRCRRWPARRRRRRSSGWCRSARREAPAA